jgi:hypothetical protein
MSRRSKVRVARICQTLQLQIGGDRGRGGDRRRRPRISKRSLPARRRNRRPAHATRRGARGSAGTPARGKARSPARRRRHPAAAIQSTKGSSKRPRNRFASWSTRLRLLFGSSLSARGFAPFTRPHCPMTSSPAASTVAAHARRIKKAAERTLGGYTLGRSRGYSHSSSVSSTASTVL